MKIELENGSVIEILEDGGLVARGQGFIYAIDEGYEKKIKQSEEDSND